MEILMVGDKLFVEPNEWSGKSKGGLYLPEAARDGQRVLCGTVIERGPGKLLPDGTYGKMIVRRGDTVWFGSYGQSEIEWQGQKYHVVSEEEVMLVYRLEKDDAGCPEAVEQEAVGPGDELSATESPV